MPVLWQANLRRFKPNVNHCASNWKPAKRFNRTLLIDESAQTNERESKSAETKKAVTAIPFFAAFAAFVISL